jgi:lipoic acid synthetase
MSAISNIVRPQPGSKFTSPQGTRAIKDGIRPNAQSALPDISAKPPWLRV